MITDFIFGCVWLIMGISVAIVVIFDKLVFETCIIPILLCYVIAELHFIRREINSNRKKNK